MSCSVKIYQLMCAKLDIIYLFLFERTDIYR